MPDRARTPLADFGSLAKTLEGVLSQISHEKGFAAMWLKVMVFYCFRVL
jgi:hypothetical protein